MPDANEPPIHVALARVSRDLRAVAKSARNEQGGYAARSIDDVLDAVHGPLAEHGVVMIPNVTSRAYEARQSKGGGVLHHVTVAVEWELRGPTGDFLTLGPVYGEAMDSSDKATNKAMSAALKVALIQLFTIPVTGDDADLHHPEAVRGEREPLADSEARVANVTERLKALHEARGGEDPYPAAWRTSKLNGLPWYRTNGVTATEYVGMLAVLEPAEAALETAAATGVGPVEAVTEPVQPTGTDAPKACPSCGLVAPDHEPGCPEDVF